MTAIIGTDNPLAPCKYLDFNPNNDITAGDYVVASVVSETVVGVVVVDIILFQSCIYLMYFCVVCTGILLEFLYIVLSCYCLLHSRFTSSPPLRLVHPRAHGARARVPNFNTMYLDNRIVLGGSLGKKG